MVLLLCGVLAAQTGPTMDLQVDRLVSALKLLTNTDRQVVRQVMDLIRQGQHGAALARLSVLNGNNPENSSLRILTAYAQLQLGNLLGAFEEGKTAEAAPNGNSYKCFFLAKLSLVTGHHERCEREIEHVKKTGDFKSETRALEHDLKQAKAGR